MRHGEDWEPDLEPDRQDQDRRDELDEYDRADADDKLAWWMERDGRWDEEMSDDAWALDTLKEMER